MIDVEIARQNVYLAYLSLKIVHHCDPAIEARLRELESRMERLKDEFDELTE